MKHYLLLFLALALLVPATALAQTGEGDQDQAAPPEEGADTGAAAGTPATDAPAPAADDTGDQRQQQGQGQPLAEPQPQESATPAEPGLTTPNVTSDVAEAEEEERLNAEVGDEDAVDEELEGERLPWRNSVFLYDNEVSTTTFDGGSSTLSYNPYWAMSFSLRPRWYFTEDISLRLRQDLSIELTDTNTEVKNRRPVLADTIIDLVHGNLLTWQKIVLAAGPRLSLPTSIASRAYQKYFSLGLGFALSRPFEDVMAGAELGLSGRYSYTFAGSNVRLADAERDQLPQAVVGVDHPSPGELPEPQASGVTSVDHEVILGLTASLHPIEKLELSTSFTWWWTHGRDATTGCVPIDTAPDGCLVVDDGSDSHLRLLTWFTLGAAYDFTDWLNGELTYSNLTSELNPDGSRRNPFWNVDSTVSLTATFTLDKLYQDFSGTGTSPAEVVEERESDDDGSARAQAPSAVVAW